MTRNHLENFYVRYKPVRKTWGCAFEWWHPCHMILCYIHCVCVCVCVCERERDFHSVTDHPVWWNDTFYLHCDSESHFLQIWTFCNLYTCQNGKISSIFFTHFEWNVSIILSLPCTCGKIRCSVFFPTYLLFDSRKPGWVRHYILPFYFSTIFVHLTSVLQS